MASSIPELSDSSSRLRIASSARTPHAWQRAAAAKVLEANSILNAETGCGKTLVAILAIDDALRRNPGQKCAFIVPVSRLLAHQQFERLRSEVLAPPDIRLLQPSKVVEVTGYTAGAWGASDWSNCFHRADVFVGTADIFSRAFTTKGYLSLSDFSLLVIDECHHARGNSSTADLLRRLHGDGSGAMAPSKTTRVLGLTASFACCRAEESSQLEQERRLLQDIFQANFDVETIREIPSREEPKHEKVPYAHPGAALCSKDDVKRLADELCHGVWELISTQGVGHKEIRKVTSQLSTVLLELGREAFDFSLEYGVVAQIESQIDDWQAMKEERRAQASQLQSELEALRRGLLLALGQVREKLKKAEVVVPEISAKVETLAKVLRSELQQGESTTSFCGMVFVREVALALPLAHLLRKLLVMPVAVASGTGSMKEEDRNLAFARFHAGLSKLLVCTACAEEGVDVAACAFVVHFSEFRTTRSYVQVGGRARQPHAKVYYLENDPDVERERAQTMLEVAQDRSVEGPSATAAQSKNRQVIPGRHPYIVPQTGAEVTYRSAAEIFREYVAKVTAGKSTPEKLVALVESVLLVPGPCGGCVLRSREVMDFWGPGGPPTGASDLEATAYVAVLVLHARGWLDSHNDVPRDVLKSAVWPVTPTRLPLLSLRPGWAPRGLLGGEQADDELLPEAFAPPSRLGSSSRDGRMSSGAEQIRLGTERLSPFEIENTQQTVNQTFSNGKSVLRAMVDLVLGRTRASDFPPIRIAMEEGSGQWYSADNRRLFLYKVVAPIMGLKLIDVETINWTSEMSGKLKQVPRSGDVWRTDSETIKQVRTIVRTMMSLESGDASFDFVEEVPLEDEFRADVRRREEEEEGEIFKRLQEACAAAAGHGGLDPKRPWHSGSLTSATAAAAASKGRGSQGTSAKTKASSSSASKAFFLAGELIAEEAMSRSEEAPEETPEATPDEARPDDQDMEESDGEAEAMAKDRRPLLRLGSVAGAVASLQSLLAASGASQHQLVGATAERRGLDVAGGAEQRTAPLQLVRERSTIELDFVVRQTVESMAIACQGKDIGSLDAVSVLNIAVMKHYRPSDQEKLPIVYRNAATASGSGFCCTVTVHGHSFQGSTMLKKIDAKQSSAREAVRSLVQLSSAVSP